VILIVRTAVELRLAGDSGSGRPTSGQRDRGAYDVERALLCDRDHSDLVGGRPARVMVLRVRWPCDREDRGSLQRLAVRVFVSADLALSALGSVGRGDGVVVPGWVPLTVGQWRRRTRRRQVR